MSRKTTCEGVLAADDVLNDVEKTNEKVTGLEEDAIDPIEKVDKRFLVVEPKRLSISTRSKLFNAFSFDTGTLAKNHGGKPTLICEISKDWNYTKICNILHKSHLAYMDLLVWSENQDNHSKILLLNDLLSGMIGRSLDFIQEMVSAKFIYAEYSNRHLVLANGIAS